MKAFHRHVINCLYKVSSDDLERAEQYLNDDLENIRNMLAEIVLEPVL